MSPVLQHGKVVSLGFRHVSILIAVYPGIILDSGVTDSRVKGWVCQQTLSPRPYSSVAPRGTTYFRGRTYLLNILPPLLMFFLCSAGDIRCLQLIK